jgi:3-phenylpropionate/trans-cinnamate dioxygenase ferredoxin reductase subunit
MSQQNKAEETVIIAGAGHCGGRVAQSLRTLGFEGIIRIFGDEPELPYERPPLSKGLLLGRESVDSLFLNPHSYYKEANIDLEVGVRIDAIFSDQRRVQTSDGRRFGYDHIIIATGGKPRTLPLSADVEKKVFTLKTLADVRLLQRITIPGSRVCVMGAGFLGLELSATLKTFGCLVTVIERDSTPLARVLPPEIGTEVASRFAGEGVRILVDAAPIDMCVVGDEILMSLSDGSTLNVDHLVIAIGQLPVAPRIEGQSIAGPNGIQTDLAGRTAWPSIFAVGDIANSFRPRLGMHVRYESWANAEYQARAVARTIIGLPPEPEPVAWFWTEHFGLMLRISGDVTAGSELLSHQSEKNGTRLWFALDSQARLVGAAAYGTVKGVARPMRLAEKAIASGLTQDREAMVNSGATLA